MDACSRMSNSRPASEPATSSNRPKQRTNHQEPKRMKIRGAARGPSSVGAVFCLTMAAALLSAHAPAAEPVNLEGTWKISNPQSAFQPEGGSIPFTDIGRKRYAQNKHNLAKRAYEEYDYATARCASPGLPRLMLTPERFRIWQRPGWVGFQFEWNRLARQVELGGLTQPQVNIAGGPGSSEDDEPLHHEGL